MRHPIERRARLDVSRESYSVWATWPFDGADLETHDYGNWRHDFFVLAVPLKMIDIETIVLRTRFLLICAFAVVIWRIVLR